MVSFQEIEVQRRAHGLTRLAVCRLAKVNPETWRRTAKGETEPNSRTLRKLADALNQLIERQAAE